MPEKQQSPQTQENQPGGLQSIMIPQPKSEDGDEHQDALETKIFSQGKSRRQ